MKKVIFTFSAMAMVFMSGGSYALDKHMHIQELHGQMKAAEDIHSTPHTTQAERDDAVTMYVDAKARHDILKEKTKDMMSTKRNEYYKPPVKKKMKRKMMKKEMQRKMMKKEMQRKMMKKEMQRKIMKEEMKHKM